MPQRGSVQRELIVDAHDAFASGHEHLTAELRWLSDVLADYIACLRGQFELTQEAFMGLHVPDAMVDAALRRPAAAQRPDPFRLRAQLDAQLARSQRDGAALPFAELAKRLRLDGYESAALLIAIAPELDLRYHALYAYAHNDAARRQPSLDLVLALLAPQPKARFKLQSRLASSRLFTEGWIETAPSTERPSRSSLGLELWPCAEVLDFLLERSALSITSPDTLELRADAVPARTLTRVQALANEVDDDALVVLRGALGSGRRAAARALADARGRPLLCLAANLVKPDALPGAIRALGRAALLRGACPLIWEADPALEAAEQSGVLAAIQAVRELGIGPVLLALRTARVPNAYEVELELPDLELRSQLWQHGLCATVEPTTLGELAHHFRLTPLQIERAARAARSTARDELFRAARSECVHHLDALATRVTTRPSLGDLVLPPHIEAQVQELISTARHRYQVLHDWGFKQRIPYGLGTYALFSGPSGTGKTFAATAIAAELGLELYRVDLSAIVSKYIGETEKNLDRLFAEAEAASAMLVCEEADVCFGTRTSISDARDRYANMEVAFLLQRMEAHEGIVILTTNLKKNMDEAFVRRLGISVEFPFPDAAMRERLFKTLLPPQAPVEPDIDFAELAKKHELSGGNIRNVLLTAATLAAAERAAIGMRHVVRGVSRELQKMGKLSGKAMLT